MRKLLGLLVILTVIVAGGAYYYLTKVFPEDQIIAMLEGAASASDSEVTYKEIEPGPLGLNGYVRGIEVRNARQPDPMTVEEIYYQIDPIWVLRNIPFLYEYRTLTHYKVFELRGINVHENTEALNVGSMSFSDLDFTTLAKENLATYQETGQVPPMAELETLLSEIEISGLAILDVDLTSDGVTGHLKEFSVSGISEDLIKELRLQDLSFDTPDGKVTLKKVTGKNLFVPAVLSESADRKMSLRTADYFEVSEFSFSMPGLGSMGIDQILYEEKDPRTFAGLGAIATDTRFDIRGFTLPIAALAQSQEVYDFFNINGMQNLSLDLLTHSELDIENGLSQTSTLFAARDLFAINAGLTMSGFNEEFFETVGQLVGQAFADAFKSVMSGDFKGAQEQLSLSPEEAGVKFEQAIMAIAFNQMVLGYEDRSLYEKAVKYLVFLGASDAEARDSLKQITRDLAMEMQGTPVAQDVMAGFVAMVEKPGAFTVTTTISPPVSIAELTGITSADNPTAFAQAAFAQRLTSVLEVE